ncbi:uncharacterized protein LOC122367486 [Amphibalanus amphitrite]|uniref:uncharacterized protein LOC122367486 n=1 Tax=Amphibalanus amphitrite TaxID=1232801 RepID=UPI001C91BA03|nr:uncharacterized protein LOC122367486 [Amphibalanus amphitrite]
MDSQAHSSSPDVKVSWGTSIHHELSPIPSRDQSSVEAEASETSDASEGVRWSPAEPGQWRGVGSSAGVVTPEDGGRCRHGVTVTAPSPCHTVPDRAAAAALFEACDESGAGELPAGRLLRLVREQLPDVCREWLQAVAQSLTADGEDGPVTADMFRDAVSTANSTLAQLMQPGAVPDTTPPSPSPQSGAGGRLHAAGRFSLGSRASSLGILHSSQVLDTSSCSSYEGVGQQMSPVDVPALEGTIAQLQHSSRALQEERDQLQQQLQQLEETNQQLAAELARMADKNDSMSAELRRIPSLRQETERLQAALEAELRQRAIQRDQAAHQERLIAAQQEEMELLATRLSTAELEAVRAAGREDELHTSLGDALRETDALRHDLRDRDERNAASQATIAALHSTIREMRDTSLALQDEKSRTSHELSKVRKQLQTLRLNSPAGGDASHSGPASLAVNNGSIHDEIINTIQTTGDGDPILPLSGIASPELVHAIFASPLNLHFKSVPRRLRMASTPQSGHRRAESELRESEEERSPLTGVDESAELDDQFSSAASESNDSSAVYRSRPTSVLEAAVQTEPETLEDKPSEDPPSPIREEAGTQTEAEPESSPEEKARSVRLWSTQRVPSWPCTDTTCAATSGANQAGEDSKSPSAEERRSLWASPQKIDGSQPPLLHQLADLYPKQEAMFNGGGSFTGANSAGMKRTHSDGALSAPLRTRFCSMPTVEEVPDDPDADIPQHLPLRASFSLPCDRTKWASSRL